MASLFLIDRNLLFCSGYEVTCVLRNVSPDTQAQLAKHVAECPPRVGAELITDAGPPCPASKDPRGTQMVSVCDGESRVGRFVVAVTVVAGRQVSWRSRLRAQSGPGVGILPEARDARLCGQAATTVGWG